MSGSGFDYALTRTLDAPVEEVWRAWTDPAVYGRWANAEEVAMDVRPGGAWSAVMLIPGGGRVPLSGAYTEVAPGERLVMSMDPPGGAGDPVLMTLRLEADADGKQTRITLSQTFDSAQERDQAEQGSTMLLDGLAAHLAG